MKKTINILGFIAVLLFSACSPIDNFDTPEETIQGKIYDSATGELLQCGTSTQIRLMEYSWDKNPTPYYITAKPDGTYKNTKIFKGNYGLLPYGAFVPFQQFDAEGNYIRNDEVIKDIKGTVTVDFQVEPFLRVEWVGEPVLDEEGVITAVVRVTRGTNNPDYQAPVDYINLYVSTGETVGDGNYINMYSRRKFFNGNDAEQYLGQEYEIKTRGNLPAGRRWVIRAGARTKTIVNGSQRFNYSTAIEMNS